jgi:hypothetical protein
MQHTWLWSAALFAACVQSPPHATLVVDASRPPVGQAVLVMPTTCTTVAHAGLCSPAG